MSFSALLGELWIFDLFSKLHGFVPPHLSMEPAFLGLLGTYSTLRVINFETNINLISGTPDDLMSPRGRAHIT